MVNSILWYHDYSHAAIRVFACVVGNSLSIMYQLNSQNGVVEFSLCVNATIEYIKVHNNYRSIHLTLHYHTYTSLTYY